MFSRLFYPESACIYFPTFPPTRIPHLSFSWLSSAWSHCLQSRVTRATTAVVVASASSLCTPASPSFLFSSLVSFFLSLLRSLFNNNRMRQRPGKRDQMVFRYCLRLRLIRRRDDDDRRRAASERARERERVEPHTQRVLLSASPSSLLLLPSLFAAHSSPISPSSRLLPFLSLSFLSLCESSRMESESKYDDDYDVGGGGEGEMRENRREMDSCIRLVRGRGREEIRGGSRRSSR